ncbi:MAG: DUF2807 domain-containing protein [Bacteroidota bacterium]|nr:MAG: DUF2807 domain-containing protein [Bacteroidota bacterium]
MNSYYGFRNILLILLTLSIFPSCETEKDLNGNGKVTTRSYKVESFNQLNIDGVLTVYFQQGEKYAVEVKTDDNLHEIVSVLSEGESLKIFTNTKDNFQATVLNVYVTAPSVDAILLNGVTALYITDTLVQDELLVTKENTGVLSLNLELEHFLLNSDGVGEILLKGRADKAYIHNIMLGDIHAFEFIVRNLEISHQGTGNIELNVIDKLELDFQGVGNIYCKGNPTEVIKKGNGTGNVFLLE